MLCMHEYRLWCQAKTKLKGNDKGTAEKKKVLACDQQNAKHYKH